MGQKTHPIGIRLGIIKTWDSRWYLKKGYSEQLIEDITMRRTLKERLFHAGVPKIEIERAGQNVRVIIHTARPGIIIGKKGAEVEKLRKDLKLMTGKEVAIDIKEIRKPEVDAQLVAENIALQLEKRIAFRRAMKKAVASAMRFGILGVKISCSGRLAGAEISRSEWYREGRVPLHTFRADIDYGFARASTTYGVIGVKVWMYHGDILSESRVKEN
ncbi:MAG: 30S ribosomal protein S3 [Nitrospirae bacterium CG_4_10_14_0_8_um_filter_41_23]|nr:30S ribosomal protein S3 [Nitrospirota bacterium]OIP60600.1 MAG: 30S ribosomal protein S3 [Nitrospirae bacterium CG2_30_41_42]PIQ94996.1 MAG: 30S ribosomal protein S3 [Nitrospirae bacterium CG11_big_fil_rev_8_21_14_0_20_41_14]PIV41476.1 MAG: 30S ribosomal protein S3 [Nitrospirae bacterium CG02_land_8_20_14_3_00_41_53]PIW87146.1 MAG: 30S ribosomal protein S3 [Nitrospirae bacterium CG_4_8_14_3_um_filter_41_47]PIY87092.1 MAG: 30S ribosomal protein S3 [Nitrospirae bacterium CG_4_10_14_0_8_um_fi